MARPITPQDLWALTRVGRPAVAPDGSFALVPATDNDVVENKGRTRLYRVERDGTTTPLTAPGSDATAPRLSPDATRVAFLRKGDADDARPQLHLMRLDGGEAVSLTDLPLGAAQPRWTADGEALIFPAPLLVGHESVDATRAELEARKDRKVKAVVTEDRMYRFWDRWMADGEIHHLFRIGADGEGLIDLTPGWSRVMDLDDPGGAFDVAPDGEIAFHSFAAAPHDEAAFEVFRLPEGGEPTPIWPDGPSKQVRPRYSPDGSTLAFGFATEFPGYYADRNRLTLLDRESGERTVLTGDWDYSCSMWEWRPDGSGLVFAAEDDARHNLFAVATAAGTPELLARGGFLTDPVAAPDGAIWCLHQNLSEPTDVALLENGSLERITAFNADLLSEIEMGRVEDVRYPGADGDEIQMFVVYPPGFDESKQYPLVHSIHGGPHGTSADWWHYRWNPQLFAAPGYVVANVNFHGSTSWGTDFGRCIQGAWGDLPGRDIDAATDHLIERGFIDPDRTAITGGSYGGYMVAWMIGQTDRYTTAICHAGVTNLLGQWATDLTHGRATSFGGQPWDGLENIRRWSPTGFTAEMKTPTLVIHGEKDYRVVVTQGLELYGLLKAKGVESRLVYYPDEGHWILKPQNSLHWFGEFMGWLDRYLGD